ncbi:MAG TPA: acyltransferase [Phycisphaerales bacterium]|nr:acyltransferase [Phycisphaerales bacterium]
MESTKRDIGFDALRGIAIIGVVLIHTMSDSVRFGQHTVDGSVGFYYTIFLRQVINFSVPAFLFISGYFVAKGAQKHTDYINVTAKRLARVLLPYFIWSMAILLTSGILSGKIDAIMIFLKLLTGKASTPYYFVLLIAQFYILTPVLMYVNSRKNGFALIALINLMFLATFYIVRLFFSIGIPLYFIFTLPFYSWMIFFQYGLLLGANPTLEKRINSRPGTFASLAIFGLMLSFAEALLMLKEFGNVGFAMSTIKLSSCIYAIGIISFFLWLKTKITKWPKPLLLIGNYSFGIFLIHMLFLDNIVFMLSHFTGFRSLLPVFQMVVVLITIIICMGSIYVSRRILTEKISVKIFGL